MTGDSQAGARAAAAAQPVSWPRPIASFLASAEIAGLWWAIISAGLFVLLAALLSVQRLEAQALRNARLQITLQQVHEYLEADLSLGFELNQSGKAQALLEDAISRDPALQAAEVFDAAGISLFNTDRGAIGERVPDAWLDAARGARPAVELSDEQAAPWTATVSGDMTLGLPIRGPFGEIAGHASLTSRPVAPPPPWELLQWAAAAWTAFTLISLFLVRWQFRANLARTDTAAMQAAAGRLRDAQQRMERGLAALAREEIVP
jgi:hypothetical protein